MVQVHFDLPKPRAAKLGQGVDVVGLVLFERKKERMPGRQAIAILEMLKKAGVLFDPPCDTLPGHL